MPDYDRAALWEAHIRYEPDIRPASQIGLDPAGTTHWYRPSLRQTRLAQGVDQTLHKLWSSERVLSIFNT